MLLLRPRSIYTAHRVRGLVGIVDELGNDMVSYQNPD